MKLLMFPFVAIGKLVEAIIKITGRMIAVILGILFLIIGFILSLTIVGAIVGIPLIIVGFAMIIRGIF